MEMTAEQLYEKGLALKKKLSIQSLLPALRVANEGAINDVKNDEGCAYYQWASALFSEIKPKQIVELGGAMGVWDVCVLHNLPQDCQLHSITLAEDGKEFSYVVDTYPNFHPVVGDDLDLSVWPKDLDFSKTDVWFIDTLHTEDQLRKELALYSPFFKKGAIVLLDDIHLHVGMENVWNELKEAHNSFDATYPLHWTGYGILVI